YGHVSDGMICSARELGLGDDHTGIIVLPDSAGPVEAGPVQAGPVQAGPVQAGPVQAGPGEDARPVVGLDEVVVELAVTPDRGYCLSMRGVARELSHSLGVAYRDPAASVRALAHPLESDEPGYPVRVADPVGCDRFTAVAVRGIDPRAESPAWMRRRLTLAGIRSISLSVDITNYLMLELGQPMHAFDLGRLAGELVGRRARARGRLPTLDGVERDP